MGSCAGFDERRRDAFKRFRATDEDKPVIDARADGLSGRTEPQGMDNDMIVLRRLKSNGRGGALCKAA